MNSNKISMRAVDGSFIPKWISASAGCKHFSFFVLSLRVSHECLLFKHRCSWTAVERCWMFLKRRACRKIMGLLQSRQHGQSTTLLKQHNLELKNLSCISRSRCNYNMRDDLSNAQMCNKDCATKFESKY